MKIFPQQRFVLIVVRDLAETNIVLPSNEKLQPYGEVVAVGPECKFLKIGDHCMFLMANGIGFEQKKDHFVIPEVSVFALIEPDEPIPMS